MEGCTLLLHDIPSVEPAKSKKTLTVRSGFSGEDMDLGTTSGSVESLYKLTCFKQYTGF